MSPKRMAAGRKLCGILIESKPIEARKRAFAIGIGVNCLQHLDENIVFRLQVDVMHIHITDDAILVDHEDGALALAFLAQHAVHLRHAAVRVKIAQKRVGDTTLRSPQPKPGGHPVEL